MRASLEVYVDAGLIVKLVVSEPDSGQAETLYLRWLHQQIQMIAPAFFEAEADSIIRKKVTLRKELTPAEADKAFAELCLLPIHQLSLPEQRLRAWEIASEFRFPNVYDATYLALAELRGCQFGRLINGSSTRSRTG